MNRLRRLLDRLLPGDRYYRATGLHPSEMGGPPLVTGTPVPQNVSEGGFLPISRPVQHQQRAPLNNTPGEPLPSFRDLPPPAEPVRWGGTVAETSAAFVQLWAEAPTVAADRVDYAAKLRAMAPKVASTNVDNHGPRERKAYAEGLVETAVRAYQERYGEGYGEELRFALEGSAGQDRRAYEARKRESR
jgi:hypothetical protein